MPNSPTEKLEQPENPVSDVQAPKILVVETASCRQVPLCTNCSQNVSDLQHENAQFAFKSNFDKEFDIQEIQNVRSPTKKGLAISNSTRAIAKRAKLDVNSLREKNVLQSDLNLSYPSEVQFTDDNRKVVFPESEYDILEKRLIALESELQHSGGNEDPEFKRLCKMGVIYEEKWARLYCRDYNKPINEYRNEAIGVLKQNLNIRRDGLRPFMRLMQSRQLSYTPDTQKVKRDILSASPAVNIISGRMTTPKEYSKGNVKKMFGHCVPITTLMTGPYYNYSYVQQDHCYMIENELFDIESRLKRCAPGTQEYKRLAEEGKRLRFEWKHTYEEIRRTRSITQPVSAYDLKKCVVVNRGGKRIALPVTDEEISQQLMEGDIDVEVQD
ncbi:unnamed protein product [Bursaphelenchus okinawaensis]|uniref:Uncharacterized protein n=1 Tax=Bursaphelenchus okinawaensis TaxID=465554 RepID=A0A811JSU6_9BILA|nr:unnamed protein product [Bursaphelenchus okinawaensis]CAG9080892.1 unnamed protein product [Bursaphelenchus okinawaensis]